MVAVNCVQASLLGSVIRMYKWNMQLLVQPFSSWQNLILAPKMVGGAMDIQLDRHSLSAKTITFCRQKCCPFKHKACPFNKRTTARRNKSNMCWVLFGLSAQRRHWHKPSSRLLQA